MFLKSQKGFAPILIAFLIIGAAAIIGGGVYFYQKAKINPLVFNPRQTSAVLPQASSPTPAVSTASPTPAIFDETANSSTTLITSWKTYRNKKYGFEFKYPADIFTTQGDIFYRSNEKMFTVYEFNHLTEEDLEKEGWGEKSFLKLVESVGGNSGSTGECGHDPIQIITTNNGVKGYGGLWYDCGCRVPDCENENIINGYYVYFENPNISKLPQGFCICFTPSLFSNNKSLINQIVSTFKFIK